VVETVGRGREGVDACPGALRPHHAADGELLRIRVPGGSVSAESLRALAAASGELADGRIGLTSRGNVQVRGVAVADVPALVARLQAARLVPDAEQARYERVRNILGSPLSGRRPGSLDDVDPLVHDLDAVLCARPGLALLPGRFLFAVDDGAGDVAGEGADVLAIALGAGRFAVRPIGCPAGVQVAVVNVVAAMLAVAEEFLAERTEQGSQAWRIDELTDGGARVLARLLNAGWPAEQTSEPSLSREPGVPGGQSGQGLPGGQVGHAGQVGQGLEPGLIEQRDGGFAVCALTPLGLLEPDQIAAVAAAVQLVQSPHPASAGDPLRITPWRRLVIRDLELPAALAVRELLASVGLVVTAGTAWSRITACAGRPGCAKSLRDVHADARRFAAQATAVGPALHWAGCERACGTPAGEVVRVIATTRGYRGLEPELTAAGIEVAR
jgi:precorrin-3B synthase